MNLLCNNSQRRRYLDSLCQAHLCLGSPVCLGVASARNIWNAIIVECTNLVLPPLDCNIFGLGSNILLKTWFGFKVQMFCSTLCVMLRKYHMLYIICIFMLPFSIAGASVWWNLLEEQRNSYSRIWPRLQLRELLQHGQPHGRGGHRRAGHPPLLRHQLPLWPQDHGPF